MTAAPVAVPDGQGECEDTYEMNADEIREALLTDEELAAPLPPPQERVSAFDITIKSSRAIYEGFHPDLIKDVIGCAIEKMYPGEHENSTFHLEVKRIHGRE